MNGKFLSGVLSGVVLVALAFVLGSALFPVEASRSSAAIAPKVSEDPPVVPAAADTESGPDTGPKTDAGTTAAEAPETAEDNTVAPDATTAADATPKPADVAAEVAADKAAPEAPALTEVPEAVAVVEPPPKAAAETATNGVTAAADSPAEPPAGATVATEADPPSADPSPATKPDPQVAVVAPAPAEVPAPETAPDTGVETASVAQPDQTAPADDPEAAPEVPAAVLPAAIPAVPDLARLDAGAVLGALDRAAIENSPLASIDPPEAFQPDPALAADPAAETPAPSVAETDAPAADTTLADATLPDATLPDATKPEVTPPAADLAPAPDAMADADESLPAILPGRDEAGMPGTQPESLPLQDEPLPEPDVAALPESNGADSDGEEGNAPDAELADGAAGSTLKPAARLGDGTKGVVVGRLPSIGGAAATDDTPVPEVAAVAPDANARPIDQFAATFENLDGKPTVAIVLIDTGAADLDRAGLASLPFPVSFALDPLDPATPDRAALYRAAGREVIMLATGIPDGAQASDIEVAFQSMAQGLPEAVAIMDLPDPTFQNRRPLASLVVPVVGAQGRGLLTWDAGLNAADQVARREDIPAAVVFRDLTSGGTDSAAVRRVLDRAVFKAGVDGRAVVAGTASAETVAALLEWSVEGKAATVALAPLTGVLMVE